jgi:hypothetical protein
MYNFRYRCKILFHTSWQKGGVDTLSVCVRACVCVYVFVYKCACLYNFQYRCTILFHTSWKKGGVDTLSVCVCVRAIVCVYVHVYKRACISFDTDAQFYFIRPGKKAAWTYKECSSFFPTVWPAHNKECLW